MIRENAMIKMQHFIPLYNKAVTARDATVHAIRTLRHPESGDDFYTVNNARKDERQTISVLVALYDEQNATVKKLDSLEVQLDDETQTAIDRLK